MLIQVCVMMLALADPNIPPDWSITYPLPFDANMIEPEARWVLSEPNFFSVYKRFVKKDYLQLIAKNWLKYNPLQVSRIPVGGRKSRVYFRLEHPAEIGNCAFVDRVDFRSFCVYAKHYEDGVLFIEPPPIPIPTLSSPRLEAVSDMVGELFMEND